MLITKNMVVEKKVQFRLRIKEKTYNEIIKYCHFAEINQRDFFIEKACQYIFENDEEWLDFKEGIAE